MCPAEATSDEHAPPRCIFPAETDLPPGVDLRKNLIKVPACEAHNTRKSRDDEYLLYVLPTSLGSNDIGVGQALTKVRRAIERRPSLAISLAKQAKGLIVHDTASDEWFEAAAVPLDMARINGVLDKMTRAIYFHHHKRKFAGRVTLFKNFLLDITRPKLNDQVANMFRYSDQLFEQQPPNGSNPQVFTYKFERNADVELLELCFYGKNKVLAHLH